MNHGRTLVVIISLTMINPQRHMSDRSVNSLDHSCAPLIGSVRSVMQFWGGWVLPCILATFQENSLECCYGETWACFAFFTLYFWFGLADGSHRIITVRRPAIQCQTADVPGSTNNSAKWRRATAVKESKVFLRILVRTDWFDFDVSCWYRTIVSSQS